MYAQTRRCNLRQMHRMCQNRGCTTEQFHLSFQPLATFWCEMARAGAPNRAFPLTGRVFCPSVSQVAATAENPLKRCLANT
jgi:hypothetical protein